MSTERILNNSRWMLRVLEWSDPKAKYPNLWHEGMPVHVLAFDSVATRLSLEDLIAVYHPAVQADGKKKGAFLGLSRVVGLRRSYSADQYWIDLETAYRLNEPLVPDKPPRRVFLCCNSEWPGPDVTLFRQLFDAAVAEGWKPADGDLEGTREPANSEPQPTVSTVPADGRLFCGAALGGGLHDRREHTWFAAVRLTGPDDSGLQVVRLEPTGRHGLASLLRSPDMTLMAAEGTGLSFPFGLPIRFVEENHEGNYPETGWWGLVRVLEKLSYPDFLEKIQQFQRNHGEVQRLTDERRGAGSPLRRNLPDRGSEAFHGIRILGEGRSRYAIRPFESAEGHLLFEVRPPLGDLGLDEKTLSSGTGWSSGIVDKLSSLPNLAIAPDSEMLRACRSNASALKAVLAARQAAVAVLSGEVVKTPEELDPAEADRIRREGWIYG